MADKDPAATLFWRALDHSRLMVETFGKQNKREPTEIEYKIAVTLFLAMEKAAKKDAAQARAGQAGNGSRPAPAGDGGVPDCPECGGEMWDNRVDKKTARSPDFRCKDAECGHPIWLTKKPFKKKGRPGRAPDREQRVVPNPDDEPEPSDYDDDDLPF